MNRPATLVLIATLVATPYAAEPDANPPLQTARNDSGDILFRTPLSEAGQSGIRVQGDRLFLTVHRKLEGPAKGGFFFNGNIVGQCFDKNTGRRLWEVELPGTHAGRVLESWHDSTSLVPAADDKHVVFQNLNGCLACCSHDGRLIWKRTWQAPDPDIKNARMFLEDGQLIVAMVSDKIAVPKSQRHPALPFYQLHSIDLKTGHDNWVSPTLITHATQYSIGLWTGRPVIVASMIDLSHWQFGQGRQGYLISLKDGQPILTFQLPPTIPHQKNQLCRDKFLITVKAGRDTAFELLDPLTSKVTDRFRFNTPDLYFAWTGSRYETTPFQPQFTDRILRNKGQPTPSTVHVVGDRIFFWRYDTAAIGCIDTTTGKSVLVQVPVQRLNSGTAWTRQGFQFTRGIRNSTGKNINNRVGSVRGIQRGGFGHTNPAWPVVSDTHIHWQGGAGLLYRIDLAGDFSPERISWTSIDDTGEHWTFGQPAVIGDIIYVRSQKELVKLRWK
jgi:outer membrane protein assembly factor BamB